MIDVIVPGLETSIQDYPGRIGFWNQGFPPSGPIDSWSFRLANLLVGNPAGAAGLECQYMGPTLKFSRDGGDRHRPAPTCSPKLDGAPVPLWESVAVKAGQTLEMGPAKSGVRAYIAIAGGIDTPPWLGSRSTFHKAGVGGMAGQRAEEGTQIVPVAKAAGTPGRKVKPDCRPEFPTDKQLADRGRAGPDDDWIDEAGPGSASSAATGSCRPKSDRTGFRLDGPQWTFTEKAYNKAPENGSEPSNIIDHGYPLGAINLAGQTPIILVNDGPSMGGFINPYTVPSAAFWKLGQSKSGRHLPLQGGQSVDEAQALRRTLDALCGESSLA